jgi:hypothetical protein
MRDEREQERQTMIHFLCPCCKVSSLPHADECTFRKDWPKGCADFDYIANLRSGLEAALAGLEAALAEVERHRMTPQERAVVAEAADEMDDTGRTIWDYLARTAPKEPSNG